MGYICTSFLNKGIMSTTTIKRKALRNRVKAKQRKSSIKRLTTKPTLKNIDIEEIKAAFGQKTTKKETPKASEVDVDKTEKQEKQVVDTKSSPKTEAKVEKNDTATEKTEPKGAKAKAKPEEEKPNAKDKTEKVETKAEEVEDKVKKTEDKKDKAKEEKSVSAKSTEKESTKATKNPAAKKE